MLVTERIRPYVRVCVFRMPNCGPSPPRFFLRRSARRLRRGANARWPQRPPFWTVGGADSNIYVYLNLH